MPAWNFLPFVGCHSWLPNFPQMPAVCMRDWSSQAIRSPKASLLLYYLAQYIITMLGNYRTLKCGLCVGCYGENSASGILPIWLGLMHFSCTKSASGGDKKKPEAAEPRAIILLKGWALIFAGLPFAAYPRRQLPESSWWRWEGGMGGFAASFVMQ